MENYLEVYRTYTHCLLCLWLSDGELLRGLQNIHTLFAVSVVE